MGQRGPPKTPTAQLEQRGSWRGKRRRKDGEPRLPVERIDFPPGLPDGAREIWDQYSRILMGRGLLHGSFNHALSMLTLLTYEWIMVSEYLHAGDFIDRAMQATKTGTAVSSEFVIRAKLQDQIVKLLGQFGLTPATLSAIAGAVCEQADDEEPDDDTAEASFLRVVS